jgi:unsaturated rhamnogalacturonyl hydrolase
VYALAKGVRLGLLDERYAVAASESFAGILKEFVEVGDQGMVNLLHTCQGAGLGGNPYRDGSYEYYMSEQQRTNDFKGVGPFIMAAVEIEQYKRGMGN